MIEEQILNQLRSINSKLAQMVILLKEQKKENNRKNTSSQKELEVVEPILIGSEGGVKVSEK
jgi:hypothetical protein